MDDGLIAGSNQEEIQMFIQKLKQEFKITVGPPEFSRNSYFTSKGWINISDSTNILREDFKQV